MATKKIQTASKAFFSEALVKGAEVFLNKDTVWTKETINYLSTDFDGNAELTLDGLYNATFKLRANGRYSCAKGTVYATTDPMADTLYQAYNAALRTRQQAEAQKEQARQDRQSLNWRRMDKLEELNPVALRQSAGSRDAIVETSVVAVRELKRSDTSEFYGTTAVVVKHKGSEDSNMCSVMTLTVEAAEQLCQQLADAVIKARTVTQPAVEAMNAKWAKEDIKDPFAIAVRENEEAYAEWNREHAERLALRKVNR